MLQLIDTHAHIYLPAFDDDREEIVQNAGKNGLSAIYMPAIDATTHQAMLDTESNFDLCYAMMGLHPCSVNRDYEKELEIVEEYLAKRSFIAIGETGLDFYWDKTFTSEQYAAFTYQIQLALKFELPIVIHSRNSIDECIDVVEQYPGLRGVFHCFSGNEEQARRIINTGLFLGIGGVVSFKNSGLDKVIEKTGMDQVVLETDAPYLAPVPFRGKRNEPAYTKIVAEKIAAILGINVEEVGKLTSSNALKLFNKA